jgi:tetratricopeptide (TPR) repeat protein
VLRHLAIGAKALHEKNYVVAEQELGEALTTEPNNPDLHYAMANVFRQREEWEKAAFHYSEVVRLAPGFVDGHEQLSYCFYLLGDEDDAAAEARVAVKLLPRRTRRWAWLWTGRAIPTAP